MPKKKVWSLKDVKFPDGTDSPHPYIVEQVPLDVLLNLIVKVDWDSHDYSIFATEFEGSPWFQDGPEPHQITYTAKHAGLARLIGCRPLASKTFMRDGMKIPRGRSRVCRSVLLNHVLLSYGLTPGIREAARIFLTHD